MRRGVLGDDRPRKLRFGLRRLNARLQRHLGAAPLVAVLAACLVGGCTSLDQIRAPDMPGTSQEVRVAESTSVAGRPALRLSDGSTVLLARAIDLRDPPWFKPPQRIPVPIRACFQPPLPASVDLQANQTPVQSQGGRDTCTVFAFTAGLEAAYRRLYGLTMKLSEQYLQHVQKSFWLNSSASVPFVEIQPETNGGGNLPWHAAVTERYGLPPALALPYIGSGDYQDTNQPGDRPSGLDAATLTQRALDDFNLSDVLTTYAIPGPLTTTVFPQAALEGARYRPTQVAFANGAEIVSLDWYRSQMACGHEVMFQVNLTSTQSYSTSNVWLPGSGQAIGNHAMLMVGYDDTMDAFLVKNSWGGTALNWFSYEWVRRGLITNAGVILDVAPPGGAFGTFENPQLFLGRWNLDHDGWRGVLDLYRLPRRPGSTSTDLRVGTYLGPDGQERRVNAEINGNQIQFTIDWNDPNQPTDTMQGLRFTGYLFTWDHRFMAGTMLDNRDGNTYGFHAQKATVPAGVAGSGILGRQAYIGNWVLDDDGKHGILTITRVDAVSGAMVGSYRSSANVQYAVTGEVDTDPRKFKLEIAFGSLPRRLTGYLYGHELERAAGTSGATAAPFGFAMLRVGEASATSEPPDEPNRVCRAKPYLPQCQ
jgi:hypothetical protein